MSRVYARPVTKSGSEASGGQIAEYVNDEPQQALETGRPPAPVITRTDGASGVLRILLDSPPLAVTTDPVYVEFDAPLFTGLSKPAKLAKDLDALAALPEDWNGYGSPAPNQAATENARLILDALSDEVFPPDRIIASAEGGVAFYFSAGLKYSLIECLNSGETTALVSDGRGDPRAWFVTMDEAELRRTIEEIRVYLQG